MPGQPINSGATLSPSDVKRDFDLDCSLVDSSPGIVPDFRWINTFGFGLLT
jgi:hypothetical protein